MSVEQYDGEGYRFWYKDPDEALDFTLDMANGQNPPLTGGETIAAIDVTADSGITVGDGATQHSSSAGNVVPAAPAFDNTTVTVWLFGGPTSATYYEVTIRVRTSQQRIFDSTFRIYPKKR